jgi:hypothetical protein
MKSIQLREFGNELFIGSDSELTVFCVCVCVCVHAYVTYMCIVISNEILVRNLYFEYKK